MLRCESLQGQFHKDTLYWSVVMQVRQFDKDEDSLKCFSLCLRLTPNSHISMVLVSASAEYSALRHSYRDVLLL